MTTSLSEIVTVLMLLIGAYFMLVGALGLLRMPDLFMRMSATTKSSTLGVAFTLGAAAVHFNQLGLGARAIAIIAFVFITAPIAAHMIGRAAYARNVKLWEGTIADELRDRYDAETGELISAPPSPPEEMLRD